MKLFLFSAATLHFISEIRHKQLRKREVTQIQKFSVDGVCSSLEPFASYFRNLKSAFAAFFGVSEFVSFLLSDGIWRMGMISDYVAVSIVEVCEIDSPKDKELDFM